MNYQGVGRGNNDCRVGEPSELGGSVPPSHILKPCYPVNNQIPPNQDPRNRFYNSSTEYGLHDKPIIQAYQLTQSLGETVFPGPGLDTKFVRQPTMMSTNEGSWHGGQQH